MAYPAFMAFRTTLIILGFGLMTVFTQGCSDVGFIRKASFKAVDGDGPGDGGDNGGANNGGANNGGANNGGANNGGANNGGANNGGANNGGANNGGANNGGANNGGANNGGANNGGANNGGANNGGANNGGANNGGANNGGANNGGANNGGANNGGANNGGANNGGANNGGANNGGANNGGANNGGANNGGGNNGGQPPVTEYRYQILEHYKQPKAEISNKVDLLFVTDTSGSIHEERGHIANGILNYIHALPVGTDIRIGVMLAHGDHSQWSGRLYAKHEPFVLDTRTMSASTIRERLYKNLTYTPDDWETDGGEVGLYSLNKALSDQRLAEIRSKHNFFRTDAGWAIVFISDENDICAEYPAGVTPVRDPGGKEPKAFEKYCRNKLNATTVYQRLKAVHKDKPLLVSAIVYKEYVRPDGENEIGYGYTDIVKLNNKGTLIDIKRDNIAKGLEDIGRLTSEILNLRTSFTLRYTNVDTSTLMVEVDDRPVSHTYHPATNEVKIIDGGRAQSEIVISYYLMRGKTPAESRIRVMNPMSTFSTFSADPILRDHPETYVPQLEIQQMY